MTPVASKTATNKTLKAQRIFNTQKAYFFNLSTPIRHPFVKLATSWNSDDSLGGGFIFFSPLLGEDSHFDQYFFSDRLKPQTSEAWWALLPLVSTSS